MKDYMGEELAVGDIVVLITPKYRNFSQAKVVGFAIKYIKLEFTKSNSDLYEVGDPIKQTGSQVIKI